MKSPDSLWVDTLRFLAVDQAEQALPIDPGRSEEGVSRKAATDLVCPLFLVKKKKKTQYTTETV